MENRNFSRSSNGSSEHRRNVGSTQRKKNYRAESSRENRSHLKIDVNENFRDRKQGQERKVSSENFHGKKRANRSSDSYKAQTRNTSKEESRSSKPSRKLANQIEFSFSPEIVKMTGQLFSSPESLGFQKGKIKRTISSAPKYLSMPSRLLITPEYVQNDWDLENQQKMISMEESNLTNDYQGLYEEFQVMREEERKHMEKAGLVDAENTSKSLNDAIHFQGTCIDMCPVFERVRRALENNVKSLEKDPITNKISRSRAVKAFSRPAAGQPPPLPSDVRPPHILKKTLDYLVEEIILQLPEAHSFLWDRTRSIRQDFTYQNSFGPEAIECNERIVRIHIYSLHTMAGSGVEYSQQQEIEQLNKALQTLMEIYKDVRNHGGQAPNEAEFQAYNLLSHIRDSELEREVQSLPEEVFKNEFLQLALLFRAMISQNNIVERGYTNVMGALNLFSEFFKRVYDPSTPFLIGCLLETHFNSIRFYALKTMSRCYHTKGKPFSLQELSHSIGFDTPDQLIAFLQYYEIDLIEEDDEICVDLFNKEKLENKYKLNSLNEKPKLAQAYSSRVTKMIDGVDIRSVINSGLPVTTLNLRDSSRAAVLPDSKPLKEIGITKSTAITTNHTEARTQNATSMSFSDFLKTNKYTESLTEPRMGSPQTSFNEGNNNKPQVPDTTTPLSNNQLGVKPFGFSKSGLKDSQVETKPSSFNFMQQNKHDIEATSHAPDFNLPSISTNTTSDVPLKYQEKAFEADSVKKQQIVAAPKKLKDLPAFAPAVRELTIKMISNVIEDEISSVLPKIYQEYTKERERERTIVYLTECLYEAFFSEILSYSILESQAIRLYEFGLKKKVIGILFEKSGQRSSKRNFKKRKLAELEGFKFQKKEDKNLSFKESSNIRKYFEASSVINDENQENIVTRQEAIRSLWEPLDLRSLIEICSSQNSGLFEIGELKLHFLLLVENWSYSYSKWINTKLSLKLNREKKVYENMVRRGRFQMNITSLPTNNYSIKEYFSESSFVLFECGLVDADQVSNFQNIESKIMRDRTVLRKLVELSQKYSHFKIHIFILFWDVSYSAISISEVIQSLNLKDISSQKVVQNYTFCNMMDSNGKSINEILEDSFNEFFYKCRITFTNKGKRRNLRNQIKLQEGDLSANVSRIENTSKIGLEEAKSRSLQRERLDKKYAYLHRHSSGPKSQTISSLNNSLIYPRSEHTINNSISIPDSTMMKFNTSIANSTFTSNVGNMSALTGFGNGVIEESTPFSSPRKNSFAKPKTLSKVSALQSLRDITAGVRAKYNKDSV